MKLNKLLVTIGLTFSSAICLAQAERNVYFTNNTNKPITVQRLLKDDSCMKNYGSGDVYTINPHSSDHWKVVDSNSWPICSGQNKRTNFLINENIKLSWSHSAGDGYAYWNTGVFVPGAAISIKTSCGNLGNDCSKGMVKDNNKDTHIYVNSIYNNSSWMSQMLDSSNLSSLVMPGSHDAGMSETHNCMPSILAVPRSETQSLNILNQAKAGSRYFDIRVDYDKDRLITYHRTDGWGCSGQPLGDVLDQAVQFLRENSSETLILDFSHTRKYEDHEPEDITKRVSELLSSSTYNNYLFKSDTNTIDLGLVNLKQLRGKIIIIMDYEYSDYRNPEKGFFAPYNLPIFNEYSNTTDFSFMQKDQLEQLDMRGGLGKYNLFLLSWTLTPDSILGSVYGLSQIANSNLENGINKIKLGLPKPNIIYLDYLNPSLNRSIIDLNF